MIKNIKATIGRGIANVFLPRNLAISLKVRYPLGAILKTLNLFSRFPNTQRLTAETTSSSWTNCLAEWPLVTGMNGRIPLKKERSPFFFTTYLPNGPETDPTLRAETIVPAWYLLTSSSRLCSIFFLSTPYLIWTSLNSSPSLKSWLRLFWGLAP